MRVEDRQKNPNEIFKTKFNGMRVKVRMLSPGDQINRHVIRRLVTTYEHDVLKRHWCGTWGYATELLDYMFTREMAETIQVRSHKFGERLELAEIISPFMR